MKLWAARDKDGQLVLFEYAPVLDAVKASEWITYGGNWMCLNHYDIPQVTFENSPQPVELKLIDDEKDGR